MTDDTVADAAGDASLAELLRSRLGRRHPVAAVATVVGGRVSVAAIGTGLDSRYEIGSISKGGHGPALRRRPRARRGHA